ncbi:glycosyltransferase family 4 protein [Deferrisoma camini]|uniref:glycosyltransferase family 4 protein n=1 Tax=Deferrisoma camini TaxID=1035120 RepID=UPI0004A392FA|nr:glycosyltransferase family 4 protein [Deferrisoma camini]
MTAAGDGGLRVLTFTSLFPNAVQPDFGGFVARRMGAWAERYAEGWAVVTPVPLFPRLPWKTKWDVFSRIPREERRNGWRICHPRYFMVPGVGGFFQGDSMARGAVGVAERLWREEGPFDLIDAHFVYPDGYAAVKLGRRLGVPVVVSARGTDVNLYPDLRGIGGKVRWAVRHADALIAVSQELKDRMVALGADSMRVHVIPNGVDLGRFSPRERPRGSRHRLLTVCNLVPGKGVDVVIRAVAGLEPEAELWVAGDGPERPHLEALARGLGLEARVRFLGRVPHEEMPRLYAEASLFCLASRAEGCPNVVLEALASGVPVVATRVGGIPEWVEEGRTGFLVEPGDPEAFRGALSRALAHPWDPAAIRAALRGRTWQDVAEAVEAVFRGVVGA